jgi:hypothetical protein
MDRFLLRQPDIKVKATQNVGINFDEYECAESAGEDCHYQSPVTAFDESHGVFDELLRSNVESVSILFVQMAPCRWKPMK